MDTVKGYWQSLCSMLRFNWKVLRKAVSYYASMHVIFYTEVALIMLCCVDVTLNATLLVIVSMIRPNYAYMYTGWAIDDDSHVASHFWDAVATVILSLYLLESVIRIYFCLKLAYQHHRKVIHGDLCCMKCHEPLMSAAMSGIYILPHFVSALCIIVHFIRARGWTAWHTVDYHKRYFSRSPFVARKTSNSSSEMTSSMFYKMGEHVMESLEPCRRNASLGLAESIHRLLETADLLSVVDYQCAVGQMSCRHGRLYMQLAMESVYALVNYTVIRCLFSHVINMHQYEVYNQQRRLQTRDGSRIIRVYNVRHRKTQQSRPSGMKQLPRQALMSIMSLGTNVAARFRGSAWKGTADELPPAGGPASVTQTSLKVTPTGEGVEEHLFRTMDTESDDASWSDGSSTFEVAVKPSKTEENLPTEAEEPANDNPEAANDNPEADVDTARQQQQLQPPRQHERIYNRKSAAISKQVNFEHLKITDLYPTIRLQPPQLQPQQQPQPPQAPEQETSTAKAAEAASSSATPSVLSRRNQARNSRAGSRRINDSIFTDETFYSLDT